MLTPRARVVVAVIALGCIVFIVRMVRRRQIKVKFLLLWLMVSVTSVGLAIFPSTFDKVSIWVGIAYPPNLLFLLGIIFLLLVVIQYSWELSRLEERTRRLAEELALMRAEANRPPPRGGDPPTSVDRSESD